jgi:hypothetical protein
LVKVGEEYLGRQPRMARIRRMNTDEKEKEGKEEFEE